MSTTTSPSLPASVDLDEMKASFAQHGYAVARGLFSEAEVEEIKSTFASIAENGPVPGHFEPASKEESGGDPLKEFPRVMHPHRFDALSRRNLVHPGVMTCLQELMQDDVLAAQSMFYYKPPGSRGQAMHQDNFYLL
ncbi:MAG: phytanoyl-CoA dioxygenase family protein, partial [Spartobacteria bacterium]